jgi:hypothetical protein
MFTGWAGSPLHGRPAVFAGHCLFLSYSIDDAALQQSRKEYPVSLLSVVLSTLDKITANRAQAIIEEMETGKAANEFDYFLRLKKFEELRHLPSATLS